MASSIFWIPSAGSFKLRGHFPSFAKARREKKPLIPRAVEDMTFLMGFSTPAGNAVRVHNSERLRAAGTGFIHHFWLC